MNKATRRLSWLLLVVPLLLLTTSPPVSARLTECDITNLIQQHPYYYYCGGAGGGQAVLAEQCSNYSPTSKADAIVQTALCLAWPEGGHGPNRGNATLAYISIMPEFITIKNESFWSDCGVFVATVMRASGADGSYPEIWTPTQKKYVNDNPDKYTIIEKEINDTSQLGQLLPGDILINKSHTFIYVGKDKNGGDSADAALDIHVPQALWSMDAFFESFKKNDLYTLARINP